MKINRIDINRMCDHSICHEKAGYEIILGGYKNRILLCEKCYKLLKKCIKEEEKENREQKTTA